MAQVSFNKSVVILLACVFVAGCYCVTLLLFIYLLYYLCKFLCAKFFLYYLLCIYYLMYTEFFI